MKTVPKEAFYMTVYSFYILEDKSQLAISKRINIGVHCVEYNLNKYFKSKTNLSVLARESVSIESFVKICISDDINQINKQNEKKS